MSEGERLLYKNSCNMSAMIQLLSIHEHNVERYLRRQNNNDNEIVNLLNNVFTGSTNTVDLIGNNTQDPIHLIHSDHSINPLYLNELNYGDLSRNSYTSCPISREAFTDECTIIQIKSCGHYFKKESITTWLRQNRQCPYCRTNVIANV